MGIETVRWRSRSSILPRCIGVSAFLGLGAGAWLSLPGHHPHAVVSLHAAVVGLTASLLAGAMPVYYFLHAATIFADGALGHSLVAVTFAALSGVAYLLAMDTWNFGEGN